MISDIVKNFEKRVYKTKAKLPKFRSGDTVVVKYKIPEGEDKSKFRIQNFEGVVLRVKKGKSDGTFTVRKISAGGIGVERVFPMWSPYIDGVEIVASGLTRRSRLYYLRGLSGKAARIKSKFFAKVVGDDKDVSEAQVDASTVAIPTATKETAAPETK